ncbi:MAG: lipoprotein insertase outer membrane protein LolB [Sideroxydans sp.]|nr:lipoprotein insertase outer membrane protein LolB [Sideroxydans sp.]
MRGITLCLVLLLTACAHSPTPLQALPNQAREAAAFNLNGRIAVKHQAARHSGGVRWQHQVMRDEVLLQGPLGITGARIVSDANMASLEQGGKIYQARDVETLMQNVLGWSLPLPVLQHWLQGRADAVIPAEIERDAQGRITLLQQAGWQVRYLRYADEQPDSLPSRITLTHDDLFIQLFIDEWEFNPQ